MTIQEDYISTVLQRIHQEDLDKHGAIDILAGRNFVAYIIDESDGQYSIDSTSWGVEHKRILVGDNIKILKNKVYDIYD